MNRTEVIINLKEVHQVFVGYINTLSEESFVARFGEKWSAGQQLMHLIKSIAPLAQVLGAKSFIASTFGIIDRPAIEYTELIKKYKLALQEGGKAPSQFLPDEISFAQKASLLEKLMEHVETIIEHLKKYSDEELDSLVLVHPLLGKLTIREMLQFMTYHVGHHQNLTIEYLEQIKRIQK